MLISVVMPVYNTPEKYLRESIESILNQTCDDFEFIIVDDGSKEYISQIIESYNDKRIKYVYQDNTGIVGALNKGIKISSGKYIARMDSDDISLPNRFERQVKFLDNNPEYGLCGTLVEEFDDETGELKNIFGTFKEFPVLSDILFQTIICHPTAMFRKSILDKYQILYSANFPHAEDQHMWYQMIKYSKISVIQEQLLKYRRHKNAVSSINELKGIESANNVRIMILKDIFPSIKIDNNNIGQVIESLRFLVFGCTDKNIKSKNKNNLLKRFFSISYENSHLILRLLFFKLKIKRDEL